VGPDGTLSFSRVDSGALLFSAKASFALNGGGSGGGASQAAAGKWKTIKDKTAKSCSGSEFDGSVGSATSAADCLSKVIASGARVNYAVWRGGSNKGCFMCDLTDRGDPSHWQLIDTPGAACFEGDLHRLGCVSRWLLTMRVHHGTQGRLCHRLAPASSPPT